MLCDNFLTRGIANRLEKHHNRLLGADCTMRLAKTFNRFKNRTHRLNRERLYATSLAQLLAENGEQPAKPIRLDDGWAVDTTCTLPHIDQLLADSQQIIAERGGTYRGGGERSFFQQILTDEHIAKYPSILNFATSNTVLQPVIEYMKMLPVLSLSKPLGVRLSESDQKFAPVRDGNYHESQLFHRDYHDKPMVYVIVTLRDVTMKSGPFSILPASVSAKASEAMGYRRRGVEYRITDEQMYRVADRKSLYEFACPAGSVLFVDSNACFHYGSRDCEIPRYLMMYAYTSVCRTDFGDMLRCESPTPVLDDSARTRRCRYPVNAGDSRLRRLVLDRQAIFPA